MGNMAISNGAASQERLVPNAPESASEGFRTTSRHIKARHIKYSPVPVGRKDFVPAGSASDDFAAQPILKECIKWTTAAWAGVAALFSDAEQSMSETRGLNHQNRSATEPIPSETRGWFAGAAVTMAAFAASATNELRDFVETSEKGCNGKKPAEHKSCRTAEHSCQSIAALLIGTALMAFGAKFMPANSTFGAGLGVAPRETAETPIYY